MRKTIAILFSFLFLAPSLPERQIEDTNAKIKSIFIYNFTKYIEWPSDYKSGNFIIGFLGKNKTPLLDELNTIASTKKAVNQPIEIKVFPGSKEITKCHMLIVPSDQSDKIDDALSSVRNFSTLVISEREGLARQGSAINFVVQNNKQRFELNRKAASDHKLSVSSSLISLAIVID